MRGVPRRIEGVKPYGIAIIGYSPIRVTFYTFYSFNKTNNPNVLRITKKFGLLQSGWGEVIRTPE